MNKEISFRFQTNYFDIKIHRNCLFKVIFCHSLIPSICSHITVACTNRVCLHSTAQHYIHTHDVAHPTLQTGRCVVWCSLLKKCILFLRKADGNMWHTVLKQPTCLYFLNYLVCLYVTLCNADRTLTTQSQEKEPTGSTYKNQTSCVKERHFQLNYKNFRTF